MASLRRLPNSPYWIACFRLPDGRPTQRSTKTTDRDEALRIALAYEDTARAGRAGRLTESQARRVIGDIYAMSNREQLRASTIRDHLTSWLSRKSVEAGEKSHQRYTVVVNQFLKFLGPKAAQDIVRLTSQDVLAFRDELASRVTSSTVNVSLKILRGALNQAKKDGLVITNEADKVSLLKRDKFERRAFTIPEVKKVLAAANDEWKGMVLTGLYTGLRLGDVATLTWASVDLKQKEINLVTGKTKRRQVLPIAKPLFRYLKKLTHGAGSPLFPNANAKYQASMFDGSLSKEFYRVLVAAGLAKKRTHDSTGKGRSVRREQNDLSFHCLRHTATSLLKNAGVSDSVARDLIGHDSVSVSRNYTHIDASTKREALNKLPDLLGARK